MTMTRFKKNQLGVTLIEAMITVSISAMFLAGGMKYTTDKIENQKVETLSSKIVSVMSASDQRIFIDKYDKTLWPTVTDYITTNQVQQFLKSEFIASTAGCGVPGGWNPTIEDSTDTNEVKYKQGLKLVSCDLWQNGKIELGLEAKLNLSYSVDNISSLNLYLYSKDDDSFIDNFPSMKRVLKKAKELDTKNITGSHDYSFVNMSAADPSLATLTALECIAAKKDCGFMAKYSADGDGVEYLDVMGSNSMVNTKIKFSEHLNDPAIATCFSYQWNTTSLTWDRLDNLKCGLGIDTEKNHSYVEADVSSISAERISLNKLCNIEVSGVTQSVPCGMIKGYGITGIPDNTVLGVFDDIHALNAHAVLLDVKNIEAESLTVHGELNVGGSAELNDLTVNSETTFLSDVSLEGTNNKVDNDLSVHGKTTIDNLTVSSSAIFEKDLTVFGFLDVNNGYVEAEYLKLGTIGKSSINKSCTIENAMKILRTGDHSEPVICTRFTAIGDTSSKLAWKLANARIGQVLPFDGSCPDGFEYFEAAAGRFLVGANDEQLKGLSSAEKSKLVADGDAFLDKAGNIITYNVGDTGGSAFHTLTEAEMPLHNHKVPDIKASCSGTDCAGYAMATVGAAGDTVWSNANEIPTGSAGENQAHENRPPYYTVNYCLYSGK